MTLIDVIIGIALIALIFYGLFGAFQLSLKLISVNKARGGAIALANEQMEYLRSLPYADVGTQGGIPAGDVPQVEKLSLNATTYFRRTLIQYVDAPQDGEGAADDNGITTDYKRAKVELSWWQNKATSSISMVTNIVPKGIETTAGGGTLRINVFDATADPVASAEVRVINDSTSPTIDTTAFTNIEGTVLFPGAPAASNYEIIVTKPGYSSAQTYASTPSNPNPNPAHLTVTEGDTTTASFAIDLVSQKTVHTYEPIEEREFYDTFSNALGLAAMSSTTVSGGAVRLTDPGSGFAPVGYATSTTIAPSPLFEWRAATWTVSLSTNTDIELRFFYDTGAGFALVPDAEIPGNSTGLPETSSPVDLSGLDPNTYEALRLEATLTSGDPGATPKLREWEVGYLEGPIPIGGVTFTMRGTKTIGTDGSGDPIYNYEQNHTTDGSGEVVITDLEFDTYTITIDGATEGYDIATACLPQPLDLPPDISTTTDLHLESDTLHTLLVTVYDENNDLLEDATVHLTRSGVDELAQTNYCGQAFIAGLASAQDYTLAIGHPAYATTTETDFEIDQTTTHTTTLTN